MDEPDAEALRREADHRTKNTLQLIGSIVALQGRRSPEPAVQAAMKALSARVGAVGVSHRHVKTEQVELAALVRELAQDLAASAGRDGLVVRLELTPVTVPARHGAPLALWVTEALANALRHAFPADRTGEIRVSLNATPESFTLAVEDDGVGRGEARPAFGSTILQLMAQQVKGRLESGPTQPGWRVAVQVPMETPTP